MANNRPQANAAVPLLNFNIPNGNGHTPLNNTNNAAAGQRGSQGGSQGGVQGGLPVGNGHGVDNTMKLYVPLAGEEGGVEKPVVGGGGGYSPVKGGNYSPPMERLHKKVVDTAEGPIHPAYTR